MDVLALAVSGSPERAEPVNLKARQLSRARTQEGQKTEPKSKARSSPPEAAPAVETCKGGVTLTAKDCWRVCKLHRGTVAHWDRAYTFDGHIPMELLGGVYLQPKHMMQHQDVLRLRFSGEPGAAVHVFYNDRRGLSGNYWYSGGLETHLATVGFEKHAEHGPGYDVHHGSHGNSSEWWSRRVGRGEAVSLEINPPERQHLAASKHMPWPAVMGIVVRGVCHASVEGGPCGASAACASQPDVGALRVEEEPAG